jgi:GNAT superfamily N-acetyltransferase
MDTPMARPHGGFSFAAAISVGEGGIAELTLQMRARPATLDDADEVLRLAAVMYSSMGQDPTDPRWRSTAKAQFTSRLGHDLGVFVVDHPDHAGLAASAAVTITTRLSGPNNLSARVAYVQWVATDPEVRSRGYGRAVMTAVVEWCEEHDVVYVELHATAAGEPLYRDLGFSDAGPTALRRRLAGC